MLATGHGTARPHADMLDSRRSGSSGDPHVTGRDGGATVSLHDFHRRGVTLLGRLVDIKDNCMHFGASLAADMPSPTISRLISGQRSMPTSLKAVLTLPRRHRRSLQEMQKSAARRFTVRRALT